MTAIVQPPLFYREIPLTKGIVALVDADLYPVLSQHRWYASHGYACREIGNGHGRVHRRTVYMHTEVLRLHGIAVPPGNQPDHINRNRADNRRENLRVVDHPTNLRNRGLQRNNSSGFRGATPHKPTGTWQARIKIDGIFRPLGYYPTPEAAHAAYQAARLRFGLDPSPD